MIEKKIYYVWIGDKEKPEIFYRCYKSWQEKMPDYEIVEINEKNFDMEYHLEKNRFFRECYERKLWAFVSDYIRINYLYQHGGIYLDVDMEIIKNMDDLLTNNDMEFFAGYEDDKHISVGIFGCEKNNEFLREVINFYEKEIWEKPLWTIPKIFTYIFNQKYNFNNDGMINLKNDKIKIFPREYFYPFGMNEKFTEKCIVENTYTIHWWEGSWSSLKTRLFVESKHLKGIKKIIKKLRIIGRYYLIEKDRRY